MRRRKLTKSTNLELNEAEVNWLLSIVEKMNEKRQFASGSTGRHVLNKMRRALRMVR